MQKIQINNNNVFYKYYQVDKPKGTFLILHGRGGSSKSWEKVSELLKTKQYDIYIPDLPGFGQTKLDKIYNIEDYAKLIEKFINKLSINDIFLLGHSNGGRISIILENRGNIKINKLILNNSAGILHSPSFKKRISEKISKILKLFSRIPGYSFIRKILYKLVGGHDYLNIKNNTIKQTFLNMINSDLKENIKKIQTPTLLIRGKNDTYTPIQDGYLMHDMIKKSKLIVLENEKHGIHLQNPEKLSKIIIDNLF